MKNRSNSLKINFRRVHSSIWYSNQT